MNILPKLIAFLTLVACLVAPVSTGYAAQPVSTEYRLKAAFLYNFTRFTEWPSTASENNDVLNICITGTNRFGSALDAIKGKTANNATINIQTIRSDQSLVECQLVFISDAGRTHELLRLFDGQPVLTVSDTKDFNRLGGIIQFMVINKKIRFSINVDAAHRAGLTISSKLLKLATIYQETGNSKE